jgi:hypothetical protein
MKQTRARILRGNTHAEGKILSVFEPSTEIIRKGKAGKPNEFGKMVKLQVPDQGYEADGRVTYPPCPKCEMPMRLGLMQPLEETGHERRIYECLRCKESMNVVIKLHPASQKSN